MSLIKRCLLACVLVLGVWSQTAEARIIIDEPTSGTYAQAERIQGPVVAPPAPPWPTGIYGLPYAPFGLDACDEMMYYANQFGLPGQFEGIGWRESNCRNEDGVRTSCCHGYWQMHQMHFPIPHCEAWSYRDVNSNDPLEKQKQACATKYLYDKAGGMSPWRATS